MCSTVFVPILKNEHMFPVAVTRKRALMNPILLAVLKLLMPAATWLLALLIPGRNHRLAYRETLNKLVIMELVTKVGALLPKEEHFPSLKTLVDKCYALGEFESLWAIEGLGQRTIERQLRSSDHPQDFLTGKNSKDLPLGSLAMLHAGIGLGFAKHVLDGLKQSSEQSPAQTVARFIEHCQANSRPGYLDCAVESIGLVARFEHGAQMVQAIDQVLGDIEPDYRGLLWHGAGRAVYFSPHNFIPGAKSPVRAFSMCKLEAPHTIGRQNMISGLAWAITLVNMKHPQIIEEVVMLHENELRESEDAFKNGVASAIIVREVGSPGVAAAFIASVSSEQSDLFVEYLGYPAEKAINTYLPVLVQQDRLGHVFQSQNLDSLMP
jgi:hypothetical protein